MATSALLLCALASVALAWLYGELVKQLGASRKPGWAHPLPLRAGLWALVFLVPAGLGAASRTLARRAQWLRFGDASLTLASWLCLGLLAVVFAAAVPGVSIFATLPALAAVVLGSLAAWLRTPRAHEAASLGVALTTAFFWTGIARGLEMGMGLHLTALVAAPLAICAWPFATYVQAGSARRLRWALAAVFLIGLAGAVVVEPYSTANPQGVNVIHFEDHAADGKVEATIWVDSGVDAPPAEMVRLAGLAAQPEPTPDGLRLGAAYPAPADAVALKAPRVEVSGTESTDDGLRITFRMVGPEADFLRLRLSEDVDLRRVRVTGSGANYDVDMAGKDTPGAHLLFCTGPDCDGVEYTIEVAGTEPVAGELYAIRYGSVDGLPDTARRVADARPHWAVPVHSGDRVAVRVGVSLPAGRAGVDVPQHRPE